MYSSSRFLVRHKIGYRVPTSCYFFGVEAEIVIDTSSRHYFFSMSRRYRRGKDATVSVVMRLVHPSASIRRVYPNRGQNDRLEECVVLRQEERVINRKRQRAVVMTHESFPDEELYVVEKYAKVTREGPAEFFFDNDGSVEQESGADVAGDDPDIPSETEIPSVLFGNFQDDDPDLARAVTKGLVDIDDDNEPVPENIPAPNQVNNEECTYASDWGHDGLCNRRSSNSNDHKAKLHKHSSEMKLTRLQVFEILFPTKWVKEVLIAETNKHLRTKLTYAEFLQFLGILLKISTTVGFERRSFWSIDSSTKRNPPYKFNSIMSKGWFESILNSLKFTSHEPPTYTDQFWEIRELLNEWNENMKNEFSPSWITCLDESMSKWLNQYTCPGFMVVPRKPWKCGNKYHTICCCLTGILFALELVEGKDCPTRAPPKEHKEKGKTVGLCLRLTKALQGSGSIVVMDSGFCVVKAIVELRKIGIFSHALIKKRRYWPKYIKGEEIKTHFQDKDPGHFDALKAKYDGVDFHIYCMKEPDYVLMLMTTYGNENRIGRQLTRKHEGTSFSFQYPYVCHMHYTHRDSVDNNNSRQMFPIAIEEQVKTIRWALCVFQFLLAVTEVNCYLARLKIFDCKPEEQVDFRYYLAQEMINNPYLGTGGVITRSESNDDGLDGHKKLSIPKKKTFKGSQLVETQCSYIQLKCKDCNKPRQQFYCSCSPGHIRCNDCFSKHKFSV